MRNKHFLLPHSYPLLWRSINPLRCLFFITRAWRTGQKIEGLWTDKFFFTLKFLSIIMFNICKTFEMSITECKQQRLPRPVNYQNFQEKGPRVSVTTKVAKGTMHPWEWGCRWSPRMRFTWVKLQDPVISHNIFALKVRACYKQSQTSHACRLNLSNMKCCYYSGKTQEGLQSPYYIPQHDDISSSSSGKIKEIKGGLFYFPIA